MRGEKEVQALFKPPRSRKRKGDEQAVAGAAEDEEAEESELELQDDADGDGWHHLSDSASEVEEAPVIPSPVKKGKKATPVFRKPKEFVGAASGAKARGKGKGKARAIGPEVVVEDSDVDDEVIL